MRLSELAQAAGCCKKTANKNLHLINENLVTSRWCRGGRGGTTEWKLKSVKDDTKKVVDINYIYRLVRNCCKYLNNDIDTCSSKENIERVCNAINCPRIINKEEK